LSSPQAKFFELETFASLADFKAKASLYQNYYNAGRLNYFKGEGTPLDILPGKNELFKQQGKPIIQPTVLLLEPVIRGKAPGEHSAPVKVGHHVPAPAGCCPA